MAIDQFINPDIEEGNNRQFPIKLVRQCIERSRKNLNPNIVPTFKQSPVQNISLPPITSNNPIRSLDTLDQFIHNTNIEKVNRIDEDTIREIIDSFDKEIRKN